MLDKEERELLALAIATLNLIVGILQLREAKKDEKKKNRKRRKRKR
ncbi:hypothetical protein [Cloacibacillus sp. An23]|nr:hypothetical protein [Cloacibacillus sp. An23]